MSKIPVLDKGFVAELACGCGSDTLNNIAQEFFKRLDGKYLAPELSTLTVLVKCPVFVLLNFATCGLKVITIPHLGKEPELEFYLPNAGEIGASSAAVSQDIADDMARTSSALAMNRLAYQKDGCDRFASQVLTPINVYTTVIVHGMYNDWCRFISLNNAPSSVVAYIDAVGQIMRAEWR